MEPYLALDACCHLIHAALQNNTTLENNKFGHYRNLTLYVAMITMDIMPKFKKYNSVNTPFTIWSSPTSLAATQGILVSFFSSSYWYA